MESGLGKKYSTVETVHELPCSCKKHRIIIRLLAWASKLASGSILHPPCLEASAGAAGLVIGAGFVEVPVPVCLERRKVSLRQ